MKAKRLFAKNFDEINQAELLGLNKTPDLEVLEIDYYFKIEHVTAAYLTQEGYICILIYGQTIILKFSSSVWSKIKSFLE